MLDGIIFDLEDTEGASGLNASDGCDRALLPVAFEELLNVNISQNITVGHEKPLRIDVFLNLSEPIGDTALDPSVHKRDIHVLVFYVGELVDRREHSVPGIHAPWLLIAKVLDERFALVSETEDEVTDSVFDEVLYYVLNHRLSIDAKKRFWRLLGLWLQPSTFPSTE